MLVSFCSITAVKKKSLAPSVRKLQVTCSPDQFQKLEEALQTAELVTEVKEVTRLPQTMVDVELSIAKRVLRLLEALDEHDDVQTVSTNLNIPDDVMDED